ncbi:MAG: hypothetical protein ABWY65_08530, partial [Thermoleophilaceae bacterium]
MEPSAALLAGLVAGLAIAAQVGAVSLLLVENAIVAAPRAAVAAGMGVATADLAFAVIAAVTGGAAGAALIVFSYAHSLWLALPMLFIVGMGGMLSAASTNTVLQTIVEDRMRARVVSIYMMSFLGVAPRGALCAGAVAERSGPPATLALGGV